MKNNILSDDEILKMLLIQILGLFSIVYEERIYVYICQKRAICLV